MKKRSVFLITIALTFVLLTCLFSACGGKDLPENEDETKQETDIYDQWNMMLNSVSFPVTLTTKTTQDGFSCNGRYTITENSGVYTVDYSYERLSTFEITADGELIAPEGFKTTYTGNMKLKDGKVIDQNGAAVDLSTDAFDVKGITLSESVLQNVEVNNGTFSAEIISLESLTGINVSATDAKLNISYTDAKIKKMVISYSTSSYQSEITYNFS